MPDSPEPKSDPKTPVKPGRVYDDLYTLDYRVPGTPERQVGTRDGCMNVLLGGLYAFLALGLCWWIIVSGGHPTAWIIIAPATFLVGLPFVLALCFKAWRRFALGILLVTGTVALIFGACAFGISNALRH